MSGILGAMMASGGGPTAFTITAGTDGTNIGYSNLTQVFGSISVPSGGTLPSGKSIRRIADYSSNGANFAIIGLSVDPGQGSLTSITANGHTFTGAAATGYSFSTGTAIWSWGVSNKFGFVSTTVYNGTIIHSGAW